MIFGALLSCSASFGQPVLQEKMFVHTSRDFFQSGETIWFSIYNVDGRNYHPSSLSKVAYVEVLDSTDKAILQTKIALSDGAGNGSLLLPPQTRSGIYLFRAYTNWMKNFSPELFFSKHIAIANAAEGQRAFIKNPSSTSLTGGSLYIQLRTGQQSYGKRKKVIAKVELKNENGQNVSARMSVSVYKLDSIITADESSIDAYLHNVPAAARPADFPFPPEYNGHFIYGKVINRNTRLPAKNITGYLTAMDNGNSFYNSTSDQNGNIRFLVTKLNAVDSMIVQTHSYYDRDQQIMIESPFESRYSPRQPSPFTSSYAFPQTMLEQSINAQVNQLYYEKQFNTFASPSDSIPFYYKEDMHYELDEYTRFSRVEDVFREYVRPVGVTKRQGNFHLTVFSESNRYLSDREPLVLVDGLPVFNMNSLFSYDPLKVKSIDVVTGKYFRSGSVFPGIISMTTFRGTTDGELIDENASVLPYEIVQKQRQFYSPAYGESYDAHLPDFRSQLYWDPLLVVDSTGNGSIEFYTSDLDGNFIIQVQAISTTGLMGTASQTFTVSSSVE
jgi:hypothetical protein